MDKEKLGNRYVFQQRMTEQEAERLLHRPLAEPRVMAELAAGCVKLELELYPRGQEAELVYELFVKDQLGSEEWVCYDSLLDEVKLTDRKLEEEMAAVLDRAVGQRGLSYTKCPFERLEGKKVEKKPDRGPELSL